MTAPRNDLTIAAAQSGSVWNDVASNLEVHLRLAELAANAGVDFLVFPELSLTGYPLNEAPKPIGAADPRLGALKALSAASAMTIVVGAPIERNGKLAIASLIMSPQSPPRIATKTYLHPGEERFFVAGSVNGAVTIKGVRIAIAICAEASRKSHLEAATGNGASVYAVSALESRSAYPAVERRFSGWAEDLGVTILIANHDQPTGGYASAGRSAIWTPTGRAAVAAATGEALVIGRMEGANCAANVVTVGTRQDATFQ